MTSQPATALGADQGILNAGEETSFQLLADATPIMIWQADAEGCLLFCNRQMLEFTGHSADIQLPSLATWVHDGDQKKVIRALPRATEKGQRFEVEIRLRRADGEFRWMAMSGSPLPHASAGVGVVGVCNDITDQRMAEEQLLTMNDELEQRVAERTAELKKLSVGIEQSPCSVVITNPAGGIEYVNPKFTEVTGYTAEEAVGQNPRLLKGEDGHTDFAELWQTILGGSEWRGEFHNRKKNGDYYWEIASISPILDAGGTITHFLAVKEDITERKMLEDMVARERDELQQAKGELEQAYHELKATQSQILQQEKMASIGQLAAGVAHEINNPVGFIKSNLSSLGRYVDRLAGFIAVQQQVIEGEVAKEDLPAARKKAKVDYLLEDCPDLVAESLDGAERVKEIVQNLKNFSRVDQAERAEANLNDCLESTINIVWNELKYKCTLERNYGDIPYVRCYPQQLNQVFMNLLVNSSHAIAEKGVITVTTRADEQSVFIEISDTGCGIPAENLNRIFEPFFTTKEVGKGTGLGMSISYDIIKKHDGDIKVASEVGTGTTFTIRLPQESGAVAEQNGGEQVST